MLLPVGPFPAVGLLSTGGLPLFVGPVSFLIGVILVVVLVVLLIRVVFGVVARLILIAAVVLALLWLFGAFGVGPPGLG